LEYRAAGEFGFVGFVAMRHGEDWHTHRKPCEIVLFRLKPEINDRLSFRPDAVIQ
jgi:hypothetical protein